MAQRPGGEWQRTLPRPIRLRDQTIRTLEEVRDFIPKLPAPHLQTQFRVAGHMLMRVPERAATKSDLKNAPTAMYNSLKAEGLIKWDKRRDDWTPRYLMFFPHF